MEDFYWYGQVPLANFGSVRTSSNSASDARFTGESMAQIVFSNASATTSKGETVGLTNGTIVNLVLTGSDGKVQ